jgi:hypothetical protein
LFTHPNTSISIGNNNYSFTPAPGFPDIPYAEVGRRAKVYRLKSGNEYYALKVFKYAFRKEESVVNCAAINENKEIPGLKAAERTVLYPKDYPDLVAQYPDFAYAVLMPWMKGESWFNTISQKTAITPENSLKLAKALVAALAGLEQRQMAHCDLSASNFIYSDGFEQVELVDLEEMFGVGLKTPNPIPAGTSGYSPKWIMDKGCWSAGCDRFSTGILVSEILGWRDERVNQTAYGETFFEGPRPTTEGEFGHKSERHALMNQVLGEIHPKLVELFNQVWNANSIEECPRIEDWKKALEDIPILKVGPEVLDFGNVKKSKTASATLTITNSGGGTLSGEIIPQEDWVKVNPSQIKCMEGKVSQHQVAFDVKNSLSSKFLHKNTYSRDDFLVVKINGNEKRKTIGAKFVIGKNPRWILFLLLLMLFAVFGYYLFVKPSLNFNNNVSQTVMTENARQTIEALEKIRGETDIQALISTKTAVPHTPTAKSTLVPKSIVNVGGLYLNSYCQENGWSYSEANSNSDADSWYCKGNKSTEKININSACQWQYGNSQAVAKYENANDPYSWSCYVPSGSAIKGDLNLNSYCQENGWSYSEANSNSDADSWYCKGNKSTEKININSACQWQYGNSQAVAKYENANDPYSWSCYTSIK